MIKMNSNQIDRKITTTFMTDTDLVHSKTGLTQEFNKKLSLNKIKSKLKDDRDEKTHDTKNELREKKVHKFL
jgi:hypothetical protein